MRLVSFASAGERVAEVGMGAGVQQWRPGILVGDQVVDACAVVQAAGIGVPVKGVRDLLALGPALDGVAKAVAGIPPAGALGELLLGPPVPDPEKILCIGLNYHAHAEETRLEAPPAPTIFAKFRNSLIGDGAPIVVPAVAAAELDYEGELAIVIGARAARLPRERALGAVAGVMPFNDVSARDLQMRTPQWTAGKAVDTFAPCGPALVLMDEIADIGNLRVSTRVNGETLQDGSTSALIFDVAEIVSFISSFMTLEPGDIIATGTPEGVGFTRTPPRYLQGGDEVEIEIGGVGVLRNRVEMEV